MSPRDPDTAGELDGYGLDDADMDELRELTEDAGYGPDLGMDTYEERQLDRYERWRREY